MRALVGLIFFIAWMSGIVIAKGFWSTLFAIFIPLWSYYLVVERLIERFL